MPANVGNVVVVCPGCSEAFNTPVYLHSTQVGGSYLIIGFSDTHIEHNCEGRK